MGLGDSSRRQRRILLFLSSILVPTLLLIVFAFRLVSQDAELARRRAEQARRQAVVATAQDLSARLEEIKAQELNRWDSGSESVVPERVADSPIVFAAPILENRMQFPWDLDSAPPQVGTAFAEYQRQGEDSEFRDGNPEAALDAFDRAMDVASSAFERCAARLWVGRNLLRLERTEEASGLFTEMLESCGDVPDADGIAFGLYAAERLISEEFQGPVLEQYLLESARQTSWRTPTATYLLRDLVGSIEGEAAADLAADLTKEANRAEQIVSFATSFPQMGQVDFPFRAGIGPSTWLGYGKEPWFVTIVTPAAYASPIVLGVSSQRVLSADSGRLSRDPAHGDPLGERFIDVYVDWEDDRFAESTTRPVAFYVMGIALILGITVFAGHLLLRDVNREVETAALRSQFVASVSHELKTPLTAIRMFAETLAAGRFRSGAQREDHLNTIVNETERLSRLVDNVLDFSRIEQGKKIFHMKPVALARVVKSAARAMEYPLQQQGFELVTSIDPSVPEIEADADAIEQAVLNLLTNAMKYSRDSRRIELNLKRTADTAVIEVVDHGVGVDPKDQARIFDKFYRVRSEELDRIAGAGLGLTIAAHIASAHDGRLDVTSAPERGSTFSLRIPVGAPPGEA